MPILYGVVSRGSTVLAKHAVCPGNFAEVTEQILEKIGPEDSKLTYSHGQYLFHYVSENGIIFMCITDDAFERSKAFSFLNEVKRRFLTTYGARVHSALPYAMNSDFSVILAGEMKLFSNDASTSSSIGGPGRGGRVQYGAVDNSRISHVRSEVEDLKQIMVRNIDSLAERGEKLELLVDRSENLEAGTVSFRTRSRKLSRAMCVKNVKITLCIVVIAAILLFIIVTASCGGFTYYKCKKN